MSRLAQGLQYLSADRLFACVWLYVSSGGSSDHPKSAFLPPIYPPLDRWLPKGSQPVIFVGAPRRLQAWRPVGFGAQVRLSS